MINFRPIVALAATAFVVTSSLLSAPMASAAETKTWVSGVGDDVNPCTRTAPCKTFAGAISKTEEGGQITVLDGGGFGAVNISKAITIDASEVEGGVLSPSVNAIIVNAGADDTVVLRGLDIVGGYTAKPTATECSANALNGVKIVNAGKVVVEDTRFTGIAGSSVLVAATTTSPKVVIDNSVLRNGCGPAVAASAPDGKTASVQLLNSTLSMNSVGVSAGQGSTVSLKSTTLFGNGKDTEVTGNGVIDTSDPASHLLAASPIQNPNTTVAPGAATRTWVSGVGDDANPCSRTAPCKTFAGAIGKTQNGGEINVIDNGNFGQVTITKAITIDATGANGFIEATTTGVTINAGDTQDVILRGLTIVGTPAVAQCPYAPGSGVTILGGRSVHIEKTTISGFKTTGIDITPTAQATRVVVNESLVSNVCGTGINVAPNAGQTVPVLVRNSAVINTAVGVNAATGGAVSLVGGVRSDNGTDTSAAGGSVTVVPNVKTPDPVIIEVPVATPIVRTDQRPVACKALPKKLRASTKTVLLRSTCVTTGGQKVTVKVTGKAKLIKQKGGRILVATKRSGTVTVTMSAAANTYFNAYSKQRTYRL